MSVSEPTPSGEPARPAERPAERSEPSATTASAAEGTISAGSSEAGSREDGHPGSRSDGEGSGGWTTHLREVLLVIVVLVMLWLALNVRLPSIAEIRTGADTESWASRASFVGVYALVALTPIPVSVMAVAGGVLFGLLEGTLLSLIGTMLGCWGAYWLARALGKTTVRRFLGRHAGTVESKLGSRGFLSVFMLRLMPGLPYWPVNYGAGAFGITQRDYLSASALSVIPGQLSLIAIGAFIAEQTVLHGVVVIAAWILVIGLTIWSYRSWKREGASAGTGRRGPEGT